MELSEIPKYDIGRCSSCGDCNTQPPTISENGEWIRSSDLEKYKRSKQTKCDVIILFRGSSDDNDKIVVEASVEEFEFLSRVAKASIMALDKPKPFMVIRRLYGAKAYHGRKDG